MRRGFTIIELLVASLLLGLLMTILTMIFNQSSIAWRTGMAGISDLDEVRAKTAMVRDQADSAYVWNGTIYGLQSLWDESDKSDKFNTRAIATMGNAYFSVSDAEEGANKSPSVNVGSGSSGESFNTYLVNVESAGPDRNYEETWDNIWSNPVDAILNK